MTKEGRASRKGADNRGFTSKHNDVKWLLSLLYCMLTNEVVVYLRIISVFNCNM